MSREIDPDSPLGEDIALIRTQAERCRTILTKLSSLGVSYDTVITTKTLDAILDDVVAPHRAFAVPIAVKSHGEGSAPMVRANPALSYGVGNFIENAVDFAETQVTVTGTWDATSVTIAVEDDGPGFPADVLARLGDPYISRRKGWIDGATELTGKQGGGNALGGGMGLGFFIAKTLLERSGAQVSVGNGVGVLKGACVTVSYPRASIDLAPTLSLEEAMA